MAANIVKTEENGCSSNAESASDNKQLGTMRLNDQKAGMEGLNLAKINQIIEEASKGSKFYLHKQKSQERIDARVAEMKAALSKLTSEQKMAARIKMDQLAERLECARDLTKTIVHVDMDAFYAAVEMRDNPDLENKPMAVGSNSMLSTSNYHARKYGVRAAMPGFIAKKLCPELIIVPTNFPKYTEVSRQVQEIFADYDPEFSAVSLDEAYLDLTNYLSARNAAGESVNAAQVVEEMRKRIHEKTRLTASAGIAPNAMLAKVCSDRNKPNGQFVLESSRDAVISFVRSLSIRKISGIGNVTEQLLGSLGISTCNDLWEKRELLYLLFSENNYDYFLRISMGLGSDMSGWSERERKSCSCETTFRATGDAAELASIVDQLSSDLAEDLQRRGLVGKAVTLKYKTEAFDVRTRVTQLASHSADATVIARAARKLLTAELEANKSTVLRLLGVRMSSFHGRTETKKQKTLSQLFDESRQGPAAKRAKLDAAGPEFTCPVCHAWKTSDSEIALNRHIDECLNQDLLGTASSRSRTQRTAGQTKLDRFFQSR